MAPGGMPISRKRGSTRTVQRQIGCRVVVCAGLVSDVDERIETPRRGRIRGLGLQQERLNICVAIRLARTTDEIAETFIVCLSIIHLEGRKIFERGLDV